MYRTRGKIKMAGREKQKLTVRELIQAQRPIHATGVVNPRKTGARKKRLAAGVAATGQAQQAAQAQLQDAPLIGFPQERNICCVASLLSALHDFQPFGEILTLINTATGNVV